MSTTAGNVTESFPKSESSDKHLVMLLSIGSCFVFACVVCICCRRCSSGSTRRSRSSNHNNEEEGDDDGTNSVPLEVTTSNLQARPPPTPSHDETEGVVTTSLPSCHAAAAATPGTSSEGTESSPY